MYCTCRIDLGMGKDMDMDIDYYWTGALGSNYAKIHNYMYIDIVITSFLAITKFCNNT
jgi:hypothetical protein